jgi:hypothetical protein
MFREGAESRSLAPRRSALAGVLAAAIGLIAPQLAGATGNVTVTVNPPQFDPKDGNYAVFSGSVTNAPMPDSTSGCFQLGAVGCVTQFALYPAGVPGSLQLGPQLIWGLQGTPNNTSPVAVTINMSTSPAVVPGTTYQAVLQAYDSAATLWESPRTQPFQWPPDKLSLSKVRLGESAGGDSTVRYRLNHGGTPFRGRARVMGSVFDGRERLGKFVDKVKPGAQTTVLPQSIDSRLAEGELYRVRLDAKDPLRREARFRDKLER